MSVVSNASPLINLARIGQLDLLRQVYVEITIPSAVWEEVVVEGAGQPGADEVKGVAWIRVESVENHELVQALRQELDAGEAEAIVLALELGAELLLMDEHLGRESATHLGARPIGLVGVLIEAKRKGFLSSIKPLLDSLRTTAGFRVRESLYRRVLQDEGEL